MMNEKWLCGESLFRKISEETVNNFRIPYLAHPENENIFFYPPLINGNGLL